MSKSFNKLYTGQVRVKPELLMKLKLLKVYTKINVQELAEIGIVARLECWESKGGLEEQISAIKEDYEKYITNKTNEP
jgi:hypothetical protein